MTTSPRTRVTTTVPERRRTLAALCGLAAAALALLVPLLGGAAEPGYSHAAQYISELGAAGATHAGIVSLLGFAPIGALVLGFLCLVSPSLPRGPATRVGLVCFSTVGVAYLVASVFPCDAGCPPSGSAAQMLHSLAGILEYVGAVAAMRFLALAFRGDPTWRPLAPLCLVVALVVGLAFVAMLAQELAAYRGLSQRLAEAAIFLWIAGVSAFVLRMR